MGAPAPAVLLLVLLLVAALLPATPTPADAAALLAFKASLDNGDEVLRSWQAGSDPCSWDYLSCDASGWVTRMELSDLGLRGAMPQPAGWALPPRLRSLTAAGNQLSGPIPPAWNVSESLEQLYLDGNPLGGRLTASWALPASLKQLSLRGCSLTGPLSSGWQPPPGLVTLSVAHNSLSGTLPQSLTMLANLQVMFLSENRLTGTLPDTFTFDTSKEPFGLAVWGNNLSGPIPSWPNAPGSFLIGQPGNEGLCGPLPTSPALRRSVSTTENVAATELPPCPDAENPADSKAGPSIATITGAAAGAAAAAAVVVGTLWLTSWQRRKRRRSADGEKAGADSLRGSDAQQPEPGPSGSPVLLTGSSASTLKASEPAAPTSAASDNAGSTQRSLIDVLPRLLAEGSHAAAGISRGDASTAAPTAANERRLQQRLLQLERDPPPWLISPARLFMWHTAAGELMLLGYGAFGRVYRGVMLPAVQQAASHTAESRSSSGVAAGVQQTAAAAASQPAANPGSPDPLPVAIKVMEMMDLHAFLREAGMLHRLSGSPHVVPLYGACIVQQHLMVVMELMEGGDLRAALSNDSGGALSWHRQGKQIALDIASGLAYLHANNVTHRDLKSKNVLLAPNLRAKVADVGGAALHSATYLSVGSSNFRGTLAWAAPELLLAEPCTQKIDIFSLGVVLWEIVTREVPHRGRITVPTASESCPQGVADLIEACLQPDPAQRPTAQQVLDRLRLL